MNELTTIQPMRLTAENVEAIFSYCLTTKAAAKSSTAVTGVRLGGRFDDEKLKQHEADIYAMLMQTPREFHRPGGGGWSFLNLCIDNNGRQWCDLHKTMDKLVCLGLAIGAVEFLLQRDLWKVFPGDMPYLVIIDK